MTTVNETPAPAPAVEGKIVNDDAPKKFCFTRKTLITTAVATTTVVAGTLVVVYLRAKGTDPKHVVDAAIDAAKETVETASSVS